jgi:hypothetical protein
MQILAYCYPRTYRVGSRRRRSRGMSVEPVGGIFWQARSIPIFVKFRLTKSKFRIIRFAVPSHSKGRIAIVTDAGRNAVDADSALTNAP